VKEKIKFPDGEDWSMSMKCNKCISQLACERDLWRICQYREDTIAEDQNHKDMCDIVITIIALVTLTCVVCEIVGSI
jgi:hypothetical protein